MAHGVDHPGPRSGESPAPNFRCRGWKHRLRARAVAARAAFPVEGCRAAMGVTPEARLAPGGDNHTCQWGGRVAWDQRGVGERVCRGGAVRASYIPISPSPCHYDDHGRSAVSGCGGSPALLQCCMMQPLRVAPASSATSTQGQRQRVTTVLSMEQHGKHQGSMGRECPPAPLPAVPLLKDVQLLWSWKIPFLKQPRSSSKTCPVSGS